MFVMKVKAKKLKIVLSVLSVVFIFLLIGIVAIERADFLPLNDYATCDEVGQYSLKAESIEDIALFLNQFDITVDLDSEKISEINIPSEFNSTYEEYNNVQQKIGLDLVPYKGKKVQWFQYKIIDTNENVVLLTFKGKVIGGHISSGIYGEKIKPLTEK